MLRSIQRGLVVLAGAAATVLVLAGPASAATFLTNAQAVSQVHAVNITISSSGGCSDRNNSTCTSLEQVRQTTISGIKTLKSASGCAIQITGGTETGHAGGTYSHWNGYKLDIAKYSGSAATSRTTSPTSAISPGGAISTVPAPATSTPTRAATGTSCTTTAAAADEPDRKRAALVKGGPLRARRGRAHVRVGAGFRTPEPERAEHTHLLYSLRAVSGPVIRRSSGIVDAMMPSEIRSPAPTTA